MSVIGKLSEDSVNEVKHYLACDEFEMAFEGLFLEIMQLENVSNIDLRQGLKVGQLLKLNEGTVFDIKFWEKFVAFVESSNTMPNN